MAALFPPWANTATYAVLALVAGGAVAAIVTPMLYARSSYATGEGDPIVQPIAFDHRHHVRDEKIACAFCHESAWTSANAGVPPTERCLGCHAQIWNDSAEILPLRQSAASHQPIRWQRVHSLPDFVFFDHRVHVHDGVQCAECHGHVEDMAVVYQAKPLTMKWCLDCHRQRSAPTHCSACHR
ncbi:MAG TPA: cytochrome c3 family protein [Kofleriaceae bacterium]